MSKITKKTIAAILTITIVTLLGDVQNVNAKQNVKEEQNISVRQEIEQQDIGTEQDETEKQNICTEQDGTEKKHVDTKQDTKREQDENTQQNRTEDKNIEQNRKAEPNIKADSGEWRQSGDWIYFVEDGYAVIGRYEGTKKKVSIPSKLNGYKVKKLRYYVFSGTKVTSVMIPSTVKEIDVLAFAAGTDSNHYRQEGIITAIKVAKKNKYYTSVDGVLFRKDKKTLVTYPQAKKAPNYKIPSGVETIGEFAFENNRNVEKIVLPKTVKRIESYAFDDCISLKKISLNNGLENIGCSVFGSCKSLTTITIPKTVKEMNTLNPMFLGALSLESINVHPKNKYYSSEKGVLFDKKKKIMYEYPEGKKTTVYTIPSTVETIEDMGQNSYIKELTLSPNIKTLSESALCYMTALEKVNMKKGVKEIGSSAFLGCKNLKKITIPKSVKFIGESAFEYCDKLKKMIFRTKDCTFFQGNSVIPESTVIYGYVNSTAYNYAKNYGRKFVNIETNEETDHVYSADKLIKLLPKSGNFKCGEPAYPGISYRDKNGNFVGYQPSIIHEYDTSKKKYKKLKQFTYDLVKNCTTDKQKIETISKWVHEHVEYRLGSMSGNSIESVYMIYERRYGNCMCFTQLTNYMLYLEGISTASIIVPGHEIGAAFDGKRWYIVDSTNDYMGTTVPEWCGTVEAIIFTSGRLTFDIRSTEGIYLAAVGYDQEDQEKIKSITIPSYVKGIYEKVLSDLPRNVVIKGTKGSVAEKYCKKKYADIRYSGNHFLAKNKLIIKNNIKYKVTGQDTVACIGYTKDLKGKVKMPGYIETEEGDFYVTAIASKAFENNKKITSVTTPGIEGLYNRCTIGSYAFAGCTKLKEMVISGWITKIGAYAFKGDKNLKTINIQTDDLKKKSVKNSLKGSSVQTIKLSDSAALFHMQSYYTKIFEASNSGKKVKIK